jgi:hypothetical protein
LSRLLSILAILFGVMVFTSCATFKTRSRVSYVHSESIATLPVFSDLCVDFKQIIRANSDWHKTQEEAMNEAYWNALLSAPEMDVLVAPIYEIQFKRLFFILPRYICKVQGFHGDFCGSRTLGQVLSEMPFVSILDMYKWNWVFNASVIANRPLSDMRVTRIIDKTPITPMAEVDSIVQAVQLDILGTQLKLDSVVSLKVTQEEASKEEISGEDTSKGQDTLSNIVLSADSSSVLVTMESKGNPLPNPLSVDVNQSILENKSEVISPSDQDTKKTTAPKETTPALVVLEEKSSAALSNVSQETNLESQKPIVMEEQLSEETQKLAKEIAPLQPREIKITEQLNIEKNTEEKVLGVNDVLDESLYQYHDFAVASMIKREGMVDGFGFNDFNNMYGLENAFLEAYFKDSSKPQDYDDLDRRLMELEKENAQKLLYVLQALVVQTSSRVKLNEGDEEARRTTNELMARAEAYMLTLPAQLQESINNAKEHQNFRHQLLALYRAVLCYQRIVQLQTRAALTYDSEAISADIPEFVSDKTESINEKALFPTQLKSSIFKIKYNYGYSKRNPIPKNVPLPLGIVFSIQVGAFRKALPDDFYKDFGPIRIENINGELNRYIAGCFVKEKEAFLALQEIRMLGYSDAFLVAYRDGIRIPVHEARGQ